MKKKLKRRYNTDEVLPYAIWNFGNSATNTEGVNLSRKKKFLIRCTFFNTETTHVGVASS